MATATDTRLFGKSIKRREDPRFITGRGNYTDDLSLPGRTYAACVRSPRGNAKIRKIDVAKAKAHPGVVAIFTGKDLTGVNSLPCGWLLPDLKVPPHPPLAVDTVRYVGDPVAIVIAESQDAALDAAEKLKVDWEIRPAVTATAKAADRGAAQIHEVAPSNVAFKWQIGDAAAVDAAVTSAAVVVKKRIVNQRLVANAMEPRACVARFDAATGDLTLWVTSQNPHVHRLLMTAFVLGIPEHKVRVIAPDVGGGFGSKIFLYNEETVCSWATRQIKRPIRWTSTRREAFQTDAHGRDHVTDVELALARDGKILGLRVKTVANMGAYLSTFAPAVPTYLYGTLLNGVYEIGAIHADVTGVFTNTTPVDAYRGAGRPEAAYLLERMIEAGAAALKTDVTEIRKKNFIPKFEHGYQTKVALTYDSGNYSAAFDKLLTMFDYKKFRTEQEAARKQGKLIGVGFSTYIEACTIAPSKVVRSLGAHAGLDERHGVRQRPVPGEGLSGQGGAVRPGRADRVRAAQVSRGPGARARGDVVLRSVELLFPVRRPRVRGGGGPRHGPREGVALRRRRRCRQRHQPDDRGRHGARRHRPGRRSGAVGGRGLRGRQRPARDGHDDGLRAAQGRHAADVRDGSHGDADPGQPARHQGRR